jgi:hypothetical protein
VEPKDEAAVAKPTRKSRAKKGTSAPPTGDTLKPKRSARTRKETDTSQSTLASPETTRVDLPTAVVTITTTTHLAASTPVESPSKSRAKKPRASLAPMDIPSAVMTDDSNHGDEEKASSPPLPANNESVPRGRKRSTSIAGTSPESKPLAATTTTSRKMRSLSATETPALTPLVPMSPRTNDTRSHNDTEGKRPRRSRNSLRPIEYLILAHAFKEELTAEDMKLSVSVSRREKLSPEDLQAFKDLIEERAQEFATTATIMADI